MASVPNTLSLQTIVDVIVEVSANAASPPAFNQGLIIGSSTHIPSWGANSRIRQYTSLVGMAGDGFQPTDPEYIAAELYFSQTPAPTYVWIGRQDATASSLSNVIVHSGSGGTGYLVGDVLGVDSGVAGTVQVTSLGANGAVTGITIVQDGTGYSTGTAIGTTGGAGTGCEVDIVAVASETLLQATQYCRAASFIWYGVYCCGAVKADHEAIAAYVQAVQPLAFYFFNTADSDVPTQATTDIFTYLKNTGSSRSLGIYTTTQGGTYPNNAYGGAAVMGCLLALNTGLAGSFYTAKFKSIKGVAYEPLTATQVGYVCGQQGVGGKNGNIYASYANVYTILQEGITPGGTFFYQTINRDVLAANIQYNVMNLLVANPAIPQTDAGEQQLIHAVNLALDNSVSIGYIAPGVWNGVAILNKLLPGTPLPLGYLTLALPMSQLSPGDRAARKAQPIYAAIIEAGAVHFVVINVLVQQ